MTDQPDLIVLPRAEVEALRRAVPPLSSDAITPNTRADLLMLIDALLAAAKPVVDAGDRGGPIRPGRLPPIGYGHDFRWELRVPVSSGRGRHVYIAADAAEEGGC
jgi:hypothetical protein